MIQIVQVYQASVVVHEVYSMFKGWYRKCVLPPLLTFALGWVVYTVGFILLVVDGHGTNSSSNSNYDRIPHFLVIASGPLLVLTALPHAALSGPSSTIFGFIASILSVPCFSGFGYAMYDSALPVYSSLHSSGGEKEVEVKNVLMFVGSLIAVFSWMLVTMAWNCFAYDWKMIESNDYVVDGEGNFVDPPPLSRGDRNVIFAGIARKLAAVGLLFLAANWCLFLTGLDDEIHSNVTAHTISGEVNLRFNVWTVSVVGLFVILAAAGHAGAYGGASTAMGVCTSFLGMLFLTSVGYTSHCLGMAIYHQCYDGANCYILNTSIPRYIIYQLSGAVGMCLAWAFILALWPFYFKVTERVQGVRWRRKRRRDYLRQVQDDNSVDERQPLLYQGTTTTPQQHRVSISML